MVTEYNRDSLILENLASLLRSVTTSSLNNSAYGFGDSSLDELTRITKVSLSDKELDDLYTNNLVRRIINIYPESAFTNGYRILDNNGYVIDRNNILLLESFKEASIRARVRGKAFLVFNPDNNTPISDDLNLANYKIYDDLKMSSNDNWINTNYIELQYDSTGLNRVKKRYTKKHPDTNVFIFYGNRSYKPDVLIDEDDYSYSVIEGFYTELRNYLLSCEFSRKILQNLSHLKLGINELALQLRNSESANRVYTRVDLLNQNRNSNSVLVYDTTEKLDYISQSLDNVKDLLEHLENLVAASTDDIPREMIFNHNAGSGYYTHLIIRQAWAESVKKWSKNNWVQNIAKIYRLAGYTFSKVDIPLIDVMTDIEKSELELNGAKRVDILIRNGVISPEEARTGYKHEKYDLNLDINSQDKIPGEDTGNNSLDVDNTN